MDIVTKQLLPGIVALLAGIVFIIYRKNVGQVILTSHQKIWKETLKLSSDFGKFSKLFSDVLILFLGMGFLISGLILIYRFLSSLHD